MSNIPKPHSERPWQARDVSILTYVRKAAEGSEPMPENTRPWHQRQRCVVIFDANGEPVSGVRNAEFLFHVEQCHDPLKHSLKLLVAHFRMAATLAGYSDALVAEVLEAPVSALMRAGVKAGI